jgi:inorganic pyrophosphatase
MNLWRDLPTGPRPPELIHAIIEIPSITRNKYEFDHEGGFFRLDRVLSATLHYPADYGLIPRTWYEDGDPLDVLVIIKDPTFPGCVVTARPLGIFRMVDQGEPDDKILAVADSDPLYQDYQRLSDMPTQYLDEVAHFFSHYKDLEGKRVTAKGWQSYEVALQQIRHAQELYRQRYEE